ncbi:hypothetical protein LTR36_008147 [Oleoguttula mirabilis]|uniref:Luciferase domain-containing protein n=1 Tax=Oleoguttula mirabilis TaxID=1507867 RepID=A0AAV9J8H7_9PEZI|nr:hypothetical protein LTR36_008147 [Oleoguttula mirabilis]
MSGTVPGALVALCIFLGLVTISVAIRTSRALLNTLSTRAGFDVGAMNKDHILVTTLRPLARAIPAGFWLGLTWTAFAAGYLIKTVATPPNAIVFVLGYVVSKIVPLDVSLILLTAYNTYTIIQATSTCQAEYEAFIALGPGGTPSTLSGLKRITLLAWFGRINVFEAPTHDQGNGFLIGGLEVRQGNRPITGGIAPQRQLDQRGSGPVFDYLLTCLDHFSAENIMHLRTDTSFLEKCTAAIVANCDYVTAPLFRTFGCEVAHPHHVDGSLHVMLHSDDIKTVIDAGWGERHPLARADSPWTAWFFITESRPPVPENLAFVYAPRTYAEVLTVMAVVQAGARFVADARMIGDGHETCSNHHPRL